MELLTRKEIYETLAEFEERGLLFEEHPLTREKGRFKLLARGEYSQVYDAGDCCVKVIGFGGRNAESEALREAFEAQFEASRTQENIAKVFDYRELVAPSGLMLQFILMEKLVPVFTNYGDGAIVTHPPSLGEGSEKEVLLLARDICSALDHMHKLNIFHRNIKPENIFYDPVRKIYKLGEFGLLGYSLADEGYTAPEGTGSAESDLYSLGMVLYVFMNSFHFPGASALYKNSDIQYEKGYVLPTPAHASDGFGKLISRMCSFDPKDRPGTADETIYYIDELSGGGAGGIKRRYAPYYLKTGLTALLIGLISFNLAGLKWLGAAACTVAVFWIFYYFCLKAEESDNQAVRFILYRASGWFAPVFFIFYVIRGIEDRIAGLESLFPDPLSLLSAAGVDLIKAGAAGLVFCALWSLGGKIYIKKRIS